MGLTQNANDAIIQVCHGLARQQWVVGMDSLTCDTCGGDIGIVRHCTESYCSELRRARRLLTMSNRTLQALGHERLELERREAEIDAILLERRRRAAKDNRRGL